MSEKYKRLMEEMPRIAEAVNGFENESVQVRAFDELVRAFAGEAEAARTQDGSKAKSEKPDAEEQPRKKRTRSKKQTGGKEGTKEVKLSTTPSPVKDLDLNPDGVTSFADFLAEKNPTNNHERNVVAVYWMKEIAGRDPVTRDDVYTCYRLIDSWKIPSDMNNTLQKTASHKNWLDTKDAADIKLTPQGVNAVEHDLPSS